MINLPEILVANGAGLLALTVLLLSRMDQKRGKHLSGRLFNAMIAIAFGALIVETASFLLDGVPGRTVHVLQYLLNSYLFLASCGVGTLWVLYENLRIYRSRKRMHRWLAPLLIPFSAVVLMLIVNLFGTGLVFTITEDNVYRRGTLAAVPYLVLFYDYTISLVMAVLAIHRYHHVRFFPVHYFVLPFLTGTLVQSLNYGLAVGWLSVSLAFLFVQLHLSNQNACVDELSSLYNRKYYNCVIDKLTKSSKGTIAGIMMDIDGFKTINDEFGHSAGDDVIHSLGKLLSDVTSDQTMVFRHAGDEFVVLCVDLLEPEVKQLMDTIAERVRAFDASAGKPYRVTLSMGYTICNAEDFEPNRFLRRMDEKMYEAKAAHYSQKNADRRKAHATAETE